MLIIINKCFTMIAQLSAMYIDTSILLKFNNIDVINNINL